MWWIAVAFLLAVLAVVVYASANIKSGIFIKAHCVSPDGASVLLTFDDGPEPDVTPRVLDVLERHGAKVVFFVIGEKAERHPELIAEIVRRGHEVGNHTYSHSPYANFLGAGHLREELRRCSEAIGRATGRVPRLFRPPLGISTHYMASVLRKEGLEAVGWTIRSFDTRDEPREKVLARVVRQLRPGAVVLLHDRLEGADWLAERILAECEARGIAVGGAQSTLEEGFAHKDR